MASTTTTGRPAQAPDHAQGTGHRQAPETQTHTPAAPASAPPSATLSQTLWGQDFLDDLPYAPPEFAGIEIVRGDWSRAASFLASFPELHEAPGKLALRPEIAEAKRRYMSTLSDLIECRKGGQTIGLFIGAPEDWSTYYCRALVVHPEYAIRPLLRRFARECLEKPLSKLGVERLVGETAPTNTAMARWFLELGFHVTGQRLTDRWGPMTRFTKFLDADCSRRFAQRFGPQWGEHDAADKQQGGEKR